MKLFLILFLAQSFFAAPQFEKRTIKVGSVEAVVEIADTEEKSAHGLMFRHQMPTDEGMLFIFPNEETRSFWMKNTFLPLTIGYFDGKGKRIDLQDMEPVKSEMDQPKTYISRGPAKYALEMNRGWFAKKGIVLGAVLKPEALRKSKKTRP